MLEVANRKSGIILVDIIILRASQFSTMLCNFDQTMNVVNNKFQSFRDFLTNASHDKAKLNNQLYLMTGIIETYYEFISCILEGNLQSRDKQFPRLKGLKNADIVTDQQFSIMDETRKLRNKLLHNLLYEPTAEEIINFHKDCNFHSGPAHLSPEHLDFQFTNSVLNGFCIIDNQLHVTVIDKIFELS